MRARFPLVITAMTLACNRYEYQRMECGSTPPSRSAIAWEGVPTRSLAGEGVPTKSLVGKVVSLKTGNPIRGAAVQLNPARTVYSDSIGRFRFDSTAPERYGLVIRAIGYVAARDTIEIAPVAGAEAGAEVFAALASNPTVLSMCGHLKVRVRKPWWKF